MKFVNLSNDINNVCNLYNMTNEDIICIEKENKNLFKNNIEILKNIDNNDYENLLLNEKFLNIYSEYVKLKSLKKYEQFLKENIINLNISDESNIKIRDLLYLYYKKNLIGISNEDVYLFNKNDIHINLLISILYEKNLIKKDFKDIIKIKKYGKKQLKKDK